MSLLVARRGSLHRSRAAAADYAAEVAADNPVAWWRLEETSGATAADQVGTNALTVYGAGLNVAGAPNTGSAATFDGVDDYMKAGPRNLTTAVTLEAIVSFAATGVYGGVVGNYTTNGVTEGAFRGVHLLVNADGKPDMWVTPKFGSFSQNALASDALPLNTLVHLAGTWGAAVNGGVPRLYVNGVEVALAVAVAETGTLDGAGPNATWVGCHGINAGDRGGTEGDEAAVSFFPGVIDEPAVYTSVLAPARILAHAQAAGLA